MSRIGKLPIIIPTAVKVDIDAGSVVVTGPKGTLKRQLPKGIIAKVEDGKLILEMKKERDSLKAIYGTTRALLRNMVVGVSEGWKKQLELVGTGYRAESAGKALSVTVGYSHPVKFEAPEDISFKVEKNIITVEGIDKEVVGLMASRIRSARPPEPYKGKGIKYIDEVVRRKAGKAAKAGASA